MTQVADNKVVTLAFVLKDKSGEILDQSDEENPLVYLHGLGTLPKGVEGALNGMNVGDKKDVDVAAADAFGVRDETKVEKVARHKLGKNIKPKKGDVLRIETEEGVNDVTVVNVTPVTVTLDLNHPLAGRDIQCSLHVLAVRDASAEEIEHRHAHGPDGHGHDHHDHEGHDHDHDHAGHDHSHSHDHD